MTHFNQDGSIDYSTISNHTQWLLKSGVHGIMPAGATGEWPALSIDGRKKVAEFTIKEVNDKIPVIAGAISPNVDAYVELSKHAGSIGTAGVMIPPRKYLSGKSPLPMVVYNNPGSCGVAVSPEPLIKCAQLPNMVF